MGVSSQTISRWLKIVLRKSGITEFTGHSTRHAATSKALQEGLTIDAIRNAAGWSERSKTFHFFYNRPIKQTHENIAIRIINPKK